MEIRVKDKGIVWRNLDIKLTKKEVNNLVSGKSLTNSIVISGKPHQISIDKE